MPNHKSRVLVVDDHPIMLEGYRAVLRRGRDLEVCGVATTTLEAMRKAKLTRPQVCVTDLVFRDGSGIDLVKDFHIRFPEMRVLVVTARDEEVFAERVLQAGAVGYLSKEEPPEKLLEAIHDIIAGKICVSSATADRILHRAAHANGDVEHLPLEHLADRELETFELLGRGLTTREVATQMCISPKTVDRYRENIKTKMNLTNGTELLRRAVIWVEEKC